MDKGSLKGCLCVILGAAMWGFSGTCGQFLFTNYDFDPKWLTTARMTVAGALLTAFVILKNRGRAFEIFKNRQDLITLLVFSFIGLLMCQYTYLLAIAYSNSGTATVIQYVSPVFIVIYTCFKAGRAPERREVIAIILALTGTFLIATHGKPGELVISQYALIFGLISAVAVVVYNISPKGIIKKYGSMTVTGFGMLMGGVVFLIFTKSYRQMPICDLSSFLATIGLAVAGTLFAFTFYLRGVAEIGAVKGSMLACLEPVAATVISAIWLKTKFTFTDIAGFAFILAIIFIVTKKENKHNVQTA